MVRSGVQQLQSGLTLGIPLQRLILLRLREIDQKMQS
jgi:hypothetical protein